MSAIARTLTVGLLLLASAGCGDPDDPGGEPTPPPAGSDRVIAVDAATYADVEAAVDQTVDEAFGAVERAAGGTLTTGQPVLVSCPMRGDHVGQLSVRGTVLTDGQEDGAAATEVAREVEAAWSDLDLEPTRSEDGAVGGVRVEQDVRIGLSVQRPVALSDGSGRTARSVGLRSACLDLGEELWEQVR